VPKIQPPARAVGEVEHGEDAPGAGASRDPGPSEKQPAFEREREGEAKAGARPVRGQGAPTRARSPVVVPLPEGAARPSQVPADRCLRGARALQQRPVPAERQVADIEAEGKDIDFATLEAVHRWKTGKLIRAAVRIGGILAGASPSALKDLTAYAEEIGLAFQIADDVLNVVGSREELGKDAQTDASRGKKNCLCVC